MASRRLFQIATAAAQSWASPLPERASPSSDRIPASRGAAVHPLAAVYTENLIRVDDVMESPKLGDVRAALFRSGRPDLVIQVEVAAGS